MNAIPHPLAALKPAVDWLFQAVVRHRAVVVGTAFGVALMNVRWWWCGHLQFGFLIWNLFLAWLPLGFAELLAIGLARERWTRPANLGLAVAWLLFFPNAPYLLTDLVHWDPRSGSPAWLDLLLLLHFALLGTALGFASLQIIQRCLIAASRPWVGMVFIPIYLFGASFGIYLGRFQRWNSWDVLTAPHGVAADIFHRCFFPWEHPRTWGFTFAMTGLLLTLWWAWNSSDRAFHRQPEPASTPTNRPTP